jgi:DNA-directed RNA polymerase specialized sigma24 family protein
VRKEWQLTQDAFDRLLRWLDADPVRAGAAYEGIRHKLVKIFVYRGSTNAEELADETINRVASRLPEFESEYTGDPALYFYGVARHVHQESMRKPVAALREMPQPTPEDQREFMHRCLERCVDGLPEEQRELVLDYYSHDPDFKIAHRKGMARRHGFTLNVLRLRVHRIRLALQQCVRDCLRGRA